MTLPLDLMLLETPNRFQDMCFRLARLKFPKAQPVNFASWDRGRDIVEFSSHAGRGDVIWQCKFTKDLGATTRKAVLKSLETLDRHYGQKTSKRHPNRHKIARWILCLPVDPTGVFQEWLKKTLADRSINWEVWGKTELLRMLEQNRDVLESFFFRVYAELRDHFRTDELELVRFKLDSACGWLQPDSKVLHYSPKANVASSDLLLDVVIRNLGTVETVITGLQADIRERTPILHGFPGEGLLLPKITYKISLRKGRPGVSETEFDDLLRVKPGEVERFKIRLVDTGYAWTGFVRLALRFGKSGRLHFPSLRLST